MLAIDIAVRALAPSRPVPRASLAASCVLLVCCVAGCGGSSHKSASTGTSTAAGSPPTTATLPPGASPGVAAVFGRVLQPGELDGWVAQAQRVLGVNASSWVAAQKVPPAKRAAETATLKRLGFTGAVAERLIQSSGGPGEVVSIVVGFRSPSAARAHLSKEIHATKALGVSAEARPLLIPGGRGFVRSGVPTSYVYLFFSRGRYYFSMLANHPHGRQYPPTLFDLIFAANHQYARVGG